MTFIALVRLKKHFKIKFNHFPNLFFHNLLYCFYIIKVIQKQTNQVEYWNLDIKFLDTNESQETKAYMSKRLFELIH